MLSSNIVMKRKKKKKKVAKGFVIVVLILNIFWPGLGTLVARKFGKGMMQMILALLGLALWFVMAAAFLIFIIAWIWALVSSIKLLIKAWG